VVEQEIGGEREREDLPWVRVGEGLAGLPACQKNFITQVTDLDTVSINDFRRVENPHASQLP
jgi:hypothetical protein